MSASTLKSLALSLLLSVLFMAAGGFPPHAELTRRAPGNVTIIHKTPAPVSAVDEGAIGLGIPHVIV